VYVGTGPRRLRLNSVGLARNGFDEGTIHQLQQWVESGSDELPAIAAAQAEIARYRELSGRR
jgi:acyl-[acyl carrier protein]--UDP-N-acetylglucosamine O-acyltransferase